MYDTAVLYDKADLLKDVYGGGFWVRREIVADDLVYHDDSRAKLKSELYLAIPELGFDIDEHIDDSYHPAFKNAAVMTNQLIAVREYCDMLDPVAQEFAKWCEKEYARYFDMLVQFIASIMRDPGGCFLER